MLAQENISRWFQGLAVSSSVDARIFCIPYAGGGAGVFSSWQAVFPPKCQICPVQLPGRGERFKELAITNLAELVENLADAIIPFISKQYYFFGHSMGARVAYELTCELDRRGERLPNEVFLSGARGPQVVRREKNLHHLPHDQFLREVAGLNGTPKEVLENKALMELVAPTLRADFKVCETWPVGGEYVLNMPFRLFGGLNDQNVSVEDILRWKGCTSAESTSYLIPGGHFFIESHRAQLLDVMRQKVESSLSCI